MLQTAGEIDEGIEADELTDGDLQSVEIDHAEFDDGSYGPFEYVRINNKKKLTIRVEETYDDDVLIRVRIFPAWSSFLSGARTNLATMRRW